VGVEPGDGPDRKRYAITPEGVTDLDAWLAEPEEPQPQLQTVLFTKVVLALLPGNSAQRFLDAQRVKHLLRERGEAGLGVVDPAQIGLDVEVDLHKAFGHTPALRGMSIAVSGPDANAWKGNGPASSPCSPAPCRRRWWRRCSRPTSSSCGSAARAAG
jgi:hypothetical protein